MNTEVEKMSAKALYTDLSTQIITQLILANDLAALWDLQKDRNEYVKFSADWQAVNLDDFIDNLNITDDKYNYTGLKPDGSPNYRKISFYDDGKAYEIVCSVGARYFRIQRQAYYDADGAKHGAVYVGLDLKEPKISKGLKGLDAKHERDRLTHFRMTHKHTGGTK